MPDIRTIVVEVLRYDPDGEAAPYVQSWPIEFTDEVIANSKKGLAVFSRLFERYQRIAGAALADDAQDMDRYANTLLDTDHGPFARRYAAMRGIAYTGTPLAPITSLPRYIRPV